MAGERATPWFFPSGPAINTNNTESRIPRLTPTKSFQWLGQLPDLRDTQAGKDLIAIGIEKGIEKGMEKGIEKGALIGTIRTCQSVFGLELSIESDLHAESIAALAKMASELQASVRSRFGLK